MPIPPNAGHSSSKDPSATAGLAVAKRADEAHCHDSISASRRVKQPKMRVVETMTMARCYEVTCLARLSARGPEGATVDREVIRFSCMAPALPVFENAFCAVARGTLIATATGPVAIEDLKPGMGVQTADNGMQPVLWIGATCLAPDAIACSTMPYLVRITQDSFGFGRPAPDLLLGSGARLLRRGALGSGTLEPVTAYADSECVVKISPPAHVMVYHMAFSRHQIIFANGLEIESYHPGPNAECGLHGDTLDLYLRLLRPLRNLKDFGPAIYRREPLGQIGAG